MNEQNEPRVVAVTGASSGVGVAIAQGFAEAGWAVAIGARRADRLEAVAEQLRGQGATVFAHRLDVTDPASVDAFWAAAEAELGPITALVNNAGMAAPGRMGVVDHEAIQQVIGVGLTGAILMTNRAMCDMRDSGGDVVLISSDAAVDATPLVASYGAAKAGLEHFARCLRLELEGTRVRVGVVRIGQAASEFTAAWPEAALGELFEEWQAKGVLRDFGFLQGPEIAQAAVLMASQPANLKLDFLEIRALPPEGGMTEEQVAEAQAVKA